MKNDKTLKHETFSILCKYTRLRPVIQYYCTLHPTMATVSTE